MFFNSFKKPKDQSLTDKLDLAMTVDARMALMWLSVDGEVIEVNKNFCALLGYERDEIIGKKHEMLVQDGNDEKNQELWASLRRGESVSGSFPRITKTGREIWVELSCMPIMNDVGEVVKVVGFASDATEKITAEMNDKSSLRAIDRSMATIEFERDGTIISANENFLRSTGYNLDEIKGKHHQIFLKEEEIKSKASEDFWAELLQAKVQMGEFRRRGKNNKEVWLLAVYSPILDAHGQVVKVVKFAGDVTQAKQTNMDNQGQLAALGRSQAVIEFEPDGTIISANENFLKVLGYELDEILGQKHSLFVAPEEVESDQYKKFWKDLANGEFSSGEYLRIGKGGRRIWIQATYNPISDADGKVYKVVKFSTDITEKKHGILVLQQAISRLASNDLSVRIDEELHEDFAHLQREFNMSAQALSDVVGGISGRADAILSDTGRISAAARDLSLRTEKQAAALEETAAALDNMTNSVRGAAENAEDAAQTAQSAEARTASGLEMSRRAVEAMKGIAASSEKVSNITSVIDEIAFQTNLLALNAGVEAARAGESGRGFAVVASEVRQLAQRSSDSSREIAELVASTFEQIQSGVKLVDDSGSALEQIAGFVRDIREKVASLASSSQEQSIGLDEINKAVTELDRATQQNATMFEETSAATQALETEAEMLSGSTRQFILSGQTKAAKPSVSEDDDFFEAGGAVSR